jgi:hypothetical protein
MSWSCWSTLEIGTSPPLIGLAATSPSPQIGDIDEDGARCCSCVHKKGIKNRIANAKNIKMEMQQLRVQTTFSPSFNASHHHLCLREQMKPVAMIVEKTKELLKMTVIHDELADTYQTQIIKWLTHKKWML